jgi:hypothetical protein
MDPGKPEIVSEDKQIERLLADAFGGPPQVFRVFHITRKYEVEVLAVPESPEPDLCSLGTMGLWRTPLIAPKFPETSRVELAGIFELNREGAREVLAAAAFRIMRTQKPVPSGTIFLNCLHDWYPKATVPHLFFVPANLWSFPHLQPTRMGALQIQFLQVIPITESESLFAQEHGSQALEAKLLGASANIADLKRNACL